MTIEVGTPGTAELVAVVAALRQWQRDDAPIQLHPGDLGWYWRFGPRATAAATRTWRAQGELVAIGLLDEPEVLRLAFSPQAWRDEEVTQRVVTDLVDPGRGVLPTGKVSVEAPTGARVPDLLSDLGWSAGEPWTPLRHDLTGVMDHPGLRVEVIRPGREPDYAAVHRSAFDSPRFTDDRWREMAAGEPFADARCLLGYDERGVAVAEVTVWSAGPGRPGLLEPMGVHAAHRGRGHGRSICLAAAAELKALGASSALVCTPSSLVGAVATYRAAGFRPLPERVDRVREA